MSPKIRMTAQQLIDAAEEEIETISVRAAIELHGKTDVVFVDLREIRELEREGRIPGAIHCPRGVLEFRIDPTNSAHDPAFEQDKRYVFFCAGGLRSALAAQIAQRMGLEPVCHVAGGFGAWRRAGGPLEREIAEPGAD